MRKIKKTIKTQLTYFFTLPFYLFTSLTGKAESHRSVFEPEKTFSLIAGVLEWKDASLKPFSKKNRKDQELDQTLKKMGVPDPQRTLLLDEKATSKNIQTALESIIKKAPVGSTH
jgi:hypothetical protein